MEMPMMVDPSLPEPMGEGVVLPLNDIAVPFKGAAAAAMTVETADVEQFPLTQPWMIAPASAGVMTEEDMTAAEPLLAISERSSI